jgi:hypothetical protein
MNQLIVARFNEDLSWIQHVQGWEKLIVNKGEFFQLSPNFAQIKVENVGREPETFLSYILENWDALPKQMAFVQGNPFDHAPEAVLELNSLAKKSVAFAWLNEKAKISCDRLGNPQHPGLDIVNACVACQMLFPEEFVFVPGGQFVVSKERVKKHDQFLYEALRNIARNDPKGPWIIERLWGVLFS